MAKKKILKSDKPLSPRAQQVIAKVQIEHGICDYAEIRAKEFVRWLHSTNKIAKTKFFNRHIDKLYNEFMDL